MNLYWFQFIVWLIIRIIIGKSSGVEDTREIPNESKKKGIPGQEANGKVLENGELLASNHGEVACTVCTVCSCKGIIKHQLQLIAALQIRKISVCFIHVLNTIN